MEFYIEWGYFGLFIASFLAATVLPFSSELLLSIMLSKGASLELSLTVATMGNWLGGISSYALGRFGKWKLLERFFGLQKTRIEGLQKRVKSWGSFLAFFCWISVVGDLFAVGLGFFKISFPRVAFWMFLGKIIRYLGWSYLTLLGTSLF